MAEKCMKLAYKCVISWLNNSTGYTAWLSKRRKQIRLYTQNLYFYVTYHNLSFCSGIPSDRM